MQPPVEFGVIVITDDKQGVMYPPIYGPFASREEAWALVERIGIEPPDGGYQNAIVVPPETWDVWIDDDEKDEEE